MQTMNRWNCRCSWGLSLILAVGWGAAAENAAPLPNAPVAAQAPGPSPPPSAPAQRSATELEKLAEPIALHPDPLISIMLPAAAYPVEIVQAARFVKDTNNVPKVDQQAWDENVKAVAKFPGLVAMMDTNLTWTVGLGQAFIEQPKELMDAIQSLRAKAHKAGTLQSSPQQVVTVTNVMVLQTNVTQVVTVTNQIVQVQPANPQVIYVPTYPSTVYYPPPGYVYSPWAPLVSFGVAVGVGAIIANNCDGHGGCVWVGGGGGVWVGGGGYHGDVDIDIDNVNIDRGDRPAQQSGNRASNTSAKATQQKWQPDQGRLKNAGAASPATQEARGWASGGGAGARSPTASTGAVGSRPATGTVSPGARPSTGTASPGARPSTGTVSAGARPTTGAAAPAARPSTPSAASRPSPSVGGSSGGSGRSAFSGTSSGSSARSASSRGGASRGGGARGGGGRR